MNSDYVISGSSDFTIRIWKVSEQKPSVPVIRSQRVRTKNQAKKACLADLNGSASTETVAIHEQEVAGEVKEMVIAVEEMPTNTGKQIKKKKEQKKGGSYLTVYSKRMRETTIYLNTLKDLARKVHVKLKPTNEDGLAATKNDFDASVPFVHPKNSLDRMSGLDEKKDRGTENKMNEMDKKSGDSDKNGSGDAKDLGTENEPNKTDKTNGVNNTKGSGDTKDSETNNKSNEIYEPSCSNSSPIEINEVDNSPNKYPTIFGGRDEITEIINQEMSHHAAQEHYHLVTEMSLWNNSLRETLQRATKEKRLDDYLVSLSASLSMKTWQETSRAYANQLVYESNPTKAASYLLCNHKIYEAIEIFMNHKMYKEAYAIASCKLQEDDPVLTKILENWAQNAMKDGLFEDAAQCYVKLGDFDKAAGILGRRTDIGTMEIAAEIGFLSEQPELGASLADQTFTKYLMKSDVKNAQRLTEKFPAIQFREVQAHVFKEIKAALESVDRISPLVWLKEGSNYGLLKTLRERCEIYSVHYIDMTPNLGLEDSSDENTLWVKISNHMALAATAPTLKLGLAHVLGALGAIAQFELLTLPGCGKDVKNLSFGFIRTLQSNYCNSEGIFSNDDEPLHKSMQAYLCDGFLKWLDAETVMELNSRQEGRADLELLVTFIIKLMSHVFDPENVQYWIAPSELKKLERKLEETISETCTLFSVVLEGV